MKRSTQLVFLFLSILSASLAQQPTREQWDAPSVTVSGQSGRWIIAGKKNKATLNESDLSISIDSGTERWNLVPSSAGDLIVRAGRRDFKLRLADARKKTIVPYDTGFKTGVKISLSDWRASDGTQIDAVLFLTIALEGPNEELTFDTAANEKTSVIRQLDWPAALDASTVDYTVLSNGRGTLLPRNWKKEY